MLDRTQRGAIFADARVFGADWVPSDFHSRDAQLNEMATALEPLIDGEFVYEKNPQIVTIHSSTRNRLLERLTLLSPGPTFRRFTTNILLSPELVGRGLSVT